MTLQDKPERDGEPYLGYYDFKELDLSKATSRPIAVVTDTLGLLVDDRYRQVEEGGSMSESFETISPMP